MDIFSNKQWFSRHKRGILVWGGLAIVTLLFLAAIAMNVSPALRGPDDWRWTYAVPGAPLRHLLPTAVVLTYAVVVFLGSRKLLRAERPSRWMLCGYLAFTAAAIPVIQLSLLAAESPNVVEQLYFRTISWGSSGFFSAGSIIDDGRSFLANYPALMPRFPVHPQRYPPGIPLTFYLGRFLLALRPGLAERIGAALRLYQCQDLTLMRISNPVLATAVIQMLLPLISGLIVFPLFGLARRAFGWRAAVWTVALYPLLPSFALWAGRWDQFYPLLSVTAWYLFYTGLTEKRRWLILAAGLVTSFASFLSFGLLALAAPMGLWALLWLVSHRNGRTLSSILMDGAVFTGGLLFVWAAYQAAFGLGFWEIWQVSMRYHLGLTRSYWTWLGYHLYDFGIFLSLPIAFLLLFAFFYALLTARRRLVALPIAFGLSLILFDLAGIARGEVARVWIFLTPFAVMGAAWALTILSRRYWPAALVLGLAALQLLTFNAFLRVVNTGVTPVAAREIVYERPSIPHTLDVQLADNIRLLGYDIQPIKLSAGGSVAVTLYWQAAAPIATAYTVFTHVTGSDGQLAAQQDGMPKNNQLPTTCWRSGEVVTDVHEIGLDTAVSPGKYTIRTGMYDPLTGERLPLTGSNVSLSDAVELDVITITRPEE